MGLLGQFTNYKDFLKLFQLLRVLYELKTYFYKIEFFQFRTPPDFRN